MEAAFNDMAHSEIVQIGQEPEADLSAFYTGPDDPAIKADLDLLRLTVTAIETDYKGRLGTLPAAELATAIGRYDEYCALTSRISSYAYILKAKHATANGEFYEQINTALTDLQKHQIFFALELSNIEETAFSAMLAAEPRLARYAEPLKNIRKYQPYQLSEAVEEHDQLKDLTGRAAWITLFDEIMATMEFEFDGKPIKMNDVTNLMSYVADRAVREKACRLFSEGLRRHQHVLSTITNVLALDKANMDKKRGYAAATTERNLSNAIEDDIVEALNASIVGGYARTSHRYYELKRQVLGLDKLAAYDRNAPIVGEDATKLSFDDAFSDVIAAYRRFSPALADIAQQAHDNKWIDARATDGKDPGAFSHHMTVNRHPVMFQNWTGDRRDKYTLAHELGHLVHQYLAGQEQKSELLAETPLTLAETASIFGERLMFEYDLEREKDPGVRKVILAGKIEDMINSVVRQIAFYNFEKNVHEQRRTGKRLSPDDLGAIWTKVQTESLGPAFAFDDDYKTHWSYIPHFIHSPFYVYAYAFGDTLVNALYENYLKSPDPEAFKANYTDLLKAGGSKHHSAALAPFGIDLRDLNFWNGFATTLETMIGQLEQAIDEEKTLKTGTPATLPTLPKPA